MIDSSKKYRTRSGLEARLYANDGASAWPIHGAIKFEGGGWSPRQWYESGRYSNSGPHDFDLIEVKPERWHPIYPDGDTFWLSAMTYPTKEEAMQARTGTSMKTPVDAWQAPE